MKLSFFLFAALSCWSADAARKNVQIASDGIAADSELGMKVLSKARRVEQEDEEFDATWVAGYSIKFQGCHHIQQWNEEAADDEDVRIMTKRLVRFRLCPSSSCSGTSASGCKSGYGDYIIDMNTFVDAYFEVTRKFNEYQCEYYSTYNCDCEDDDGKGDDFDRDMCEYDCFYEADMADDCVDRNPYEDDEQQEEEFNAEEYMECKQWDAPDDNDDRRKLEDAEEEEQWFIGPYCAEQGGAIFLGLFTDDSCSTFADDQGGAATYQSLAGSELPYSAVSIVGSDCLSCLERDFNDEDNANAEDEDYASETCEEIYQNAGKCEEYLPDGMVNSPNTNACNYISGVKIIRKDGIISKGGSKPNGTATVFIVLFALAFAALAFYCYYLRVKLNVKNDTLL